MNTEELRRSIAAHIESLHEAIGASTAEAAADWIMERVAEREAELEHAADMDRRDAAFARDD